MSNYNYQDFDFLLNTLYDCVYNDTNKGCYKLKPITRKDIHIEDLKMPTTFDKNNILKGKFQYINNYNQKYMYKRISDSTYTCAINIGVYNQTNKNINAMKRSEIVNMAMMYLTSELAIDEHLKYVLLPIMNFDITIKELKNINELLTDNFKNYDENTMLYINVVEYYNKLISLEEFLQEKGKKMTIDEWKVLMFQILYTLYRLSERISKFRHNNLNLQAIKIYVRKPTNKKNIFKVGTKTFVVPDYGFDIKISDYDKSFTPEYYGNMNTDRITENPYYDMHYFLTYFAFYINRLKLDIPEIKQFIDQIIPEKFRNTTLINFDGLDEAYYEHQANEILTPSIVLKKNFFFANFIENMDMSASSVSNNETDINRYTPKENNVSYTDKSLTEDSQYSYRMLGRNIEKNINNRKKTSHYNNIRESSMIRGSRKMNVSKANNIVKNNESGILNKAEKKYKNKVISREVEMNDDSDSLKDDLEDEKVFDESDVENTKQQLKRHLNKGGRISNNKNFISKIAKSLNKNKSESETEASISMSSTTSEKNKYNLNKQSLQELSEGLQDTIIGKLPEGYAGELPDSFKQNLPAPSMSQGQQNMMGQNMMGQNMMSQNMGMQFNPMSNGPSQKINSLGKVLGVQQYTPEHGLSALPQGINSNSLPQMGMPQMGLPQMEMPQMGMPQMGMPQMGMPQMGVPQMGMPQMGMPQMGVPQMGMPQMGGGRKLKVYKLDNSFFF
jgi:hypothetical protein